MTRPPSAAAGHLARGLAVVACVLPAGCSSYRDAPAPPPIDYDAGDYPPGPYGTAVGDVVADATFEGFTGDGDAAPEAVRFGQFYDPDGKEPQRWLFVDASALWCQPCREEAQELPPLAHELADDVAFVAVIFQGQVNVPATTADAASWMKAFKLPFWTVADPAGAILAYFSASSPPYEMVIDRRTMRIQAQVVGRPADLRQFILSAIGGS